jgi:hypothetical protein
VYWFVLPKFGRGFEWVRLCGDNFAGQFIVDFVPYTVTRDNYELIVRREASDESVWFVNNVRMHVEIAERTAHSDLTIHSTTTISDHAAAFNRFDAFLFGTRFVIKCHSNCFVLSKQHGTAVSHVGHVKFLINDEDDDGCRAAVFCCQLFA